MAQYSWYTWVALPDVIYILDENKFRKSFFFFTNTKNRHILEITSPQNGKIPTNFQNWPTRIKMI